MTVKENSHFHKRLENLEAREALFGVFLFGVPFLFTAFCFSASGLLALLRIGIVLFGFVCNSNKSAFQDWTDVGTRPSGCCYGSTSACRIRRSRRRVHIRQYAGSRISYFRVT